MKIEEKRKRHISFSALMTTGAFSQNVGTLFSKLKLVKYAAANWEATDNRGSEKPAVVLNQTHASLVWAAIAKLLLPR